MFDLKSRPLDSADLLRRLKQPESGAVVTFRGCVRNQNRRRRVAALEYHAYEELARKEGGRILEEVREEYPVNGGLCVHRVGTLEVGDVAVWVGVGAAHRGDGFQACRYVIDEVKKRVPIWKKEHYEDGTAEWIQGA